jgi:diguanylate cyclase (GGDEF)-like protein/PAS domain S-box-containing protein
VCSGFSEKIMLKNARAGTTGGRGVNRYRPHILVACILAAALLTGLAAPLQNVLTDMRFRWFPRAASGDIVLVAIDARSIQEIGVWPWPRQLHADLIGRLQRAGVGDIVFDVDFSSASNPAADKAFAEALARAGGSVVLPMFKQLTVAGNRASTTVNRPLPQFAAHSWGAVVNVTVESDGLVRHYAFGDMFDDGFQPSVGALLAGRYEMHLAPLRIDFSISPGSIPTIAYVDVLRGGPATLQGLKGKKVIVGATAVELGDHFSVPNGRVIAGPQLQVLAAESLLQNRLLRPTSAILTVAGLLALALLMALMWRRSSAGWRVAVLAAGAVAVETAAILLQAKLAIVVDTAFWHIAIAAYLAVTALDEIDFRSLLGGIADRRFQRIAMSLADGLVCTDKDGLVTVWNPGAAAIFGYAADEMRGRPLDRVCAFAEGEYPVTAPFSILSLMPGVEAGGTVMELEGRRKSGETFPLEASFSKWQGVDGFQFGVVMRDISVRKREAERIRYLAEYDTLTDLANRNKLYERLHAMLAAEADAGREVALIVLDLDRFKHVNDTLGQACGDELLCAVARRLTAMVAGDGILARLAGDEFAIAIGGAEAGARLKALARRMVETFATSPFTLGERHLRIDVSAGLAVFPADCATADELIGNADLALYHAKAAGRARCIFYDRTMRDELEARLAMEADLVGALERNELELFYQPQVSLADGRLVGAETLIRWRRPGRGLVPPDQFMPLVNASPIADRIGLWVMETACRQGRLWQQQGHALRLGINLSPSQLQSGDLAAATAAALAATGLPPALLELEVTEDVLVTDDARALDLFGRIRELGVRIAFDDFGTGYASLTYLKKFRLDKLKIDRTFVRGLLDDPDDAAIVGFTVNLGKLLGLAITAEGIEDAATAEMLARMGCEEGQGYHFSPPLPAAEFAQKFLGGGDKAATSPAAA